MDFSDLGGKAVRPLPPTTDLSMPVPKGSVAMTDPQGQLRSVPVMQAQSYVKQGWKVGQNVSPDEPSVSSIALNVAKNLPGDIGRSLLNLAFYKPAQGQTPANSGPEIQLAQQSLAAAHQAGQFGKQAVTAIRNKDYPLAAASGSKAAVSGLAAADPFAAGPVAQVNELQSQGKPNEAFIRGLTNAALLAPGVTPVRTAIGKVAGSAGDVASEIVAQDRPVPPAVQMSPTAAKMTQVFPTLPDSIAANVAPKIEAAIDPAKGINSHSDLVAATEQAKKNVIQSYRDKAPGGLIENLSANDRSSMGQDIFELEVAQRHFEGTASKAQRYAANVATNPVAQAAKGVAKIGGRAAIGYAIGGPPGAIIAQAVGASKYGGIGDIARAGANVIGRLGEPITPDILDAQVTDIFGGPQPSSSVSPLSPTSARVPSVGGVVPTVNEQEIVSALRNQGYAGEDARTIARQAIAQNPHDFDAALLSALRGNKPAPISTLVKAQGKQALVDRISQLRGGDTSGLGDPFASSGPQNFPRTPADIAAEMPHDIASNIGQDVGPTAGRSNPVANIRVTPGRFTSPIDGVPAPADPSLSIPQNWTFRNPNLNGEGALSDWLTSMPLDMLKAKAQARGIVFDGAQDPKTLTPNLVRQLVNDATPAEVNEAQAQAIERSRFPISRGGFTGGFQPPLPGGGAPPGAGPTDTASLLRQSLEARGIQVPPQLGGSGEIAEASNLNSPVQVKRFQEQAAQNVFGKPYDQLTVQQRVQLLPEATRLQSEARARVAAAPVPQPEQSIRPDLRAASIIQQAGMETLPGGGVSKELGTIIFNHPDYPGKPVIMSQDDVIKGGPEAVRAKMAARLAQPDIPRAGAPAPETPLQQGEPTSGTYGKEITVNTPSRTIPGQYKIVEADSLTPSHDPFTFAKNPEYPAGVQERAYDASQEAQNRVIQQAQDYRPNYTVNTNPDAVNGPPIVGPDGTVFGGNGRTMSTQRLYALGAGDSYRQFLSDNAAQFGVTPEQVSQFRNPVLVREIEAPDTVDAARRLGSDLNKNMTGALGVSEKSVSAGKNLRPQSLASIGSMLDDLGENASLRDLMRERGPDLLKILNKDGVITDRERPQFIDTSTGGLSEEGKTFVERALLGSVVDDPRLMDAAPKSVLNKLDRSLGDLASVGSRKDQYNVLPLLREAIADHAEAARSNMSAQQYLSQTAMFGPVRNPAVDALVLKLAEGPKAVTKAFRQFSQDASFDVPNQGMLGVTGKPSPAAAFNAAFGTNLTDEQFTDAFLQSLKKEGKIETGAGNEPSRQTVASQEAAPGVRPNPTAQTVTGSQGRAPAGNAGTQGPSGQGIIPPVSGNPQLDNLLKLLNARNKRP